MTTEPTAGDEEPVLVTMTITCHTEGCGNAGHPIRLDVPEDVGGFVCGACGEPATGEATS